MIRITFLLILMAVSCIRAAEPQIDQRAATEQYVKLRKEYAERFSTGWVNDPAREALLKLYNSDKKAFLEKSKQVAQPLPRRRESSAHARESAYRSEPDSGAAVSSRDVLWLAQLD